jgi:stage II sporulation protein AA (anti-sigma F factor antagonist)
MQVHFEENAGVVEVRLGGELDHHAAGDVGRRVAQLIDTYLPRRLILDFDGMTFMDSSGIAILLGAFRRVQDIGGELNVVRLPRQAERVVSAAGLGRLMSWSSKDS